MEHCQQKIETPCPACGHATLFIAVGGWLTCAWHKCERPHVVDAIERMHKEAFVAGFDAGVGYTQNFGPAEGLVTTTDDPQPDWENAPRAAYQVFQENRTKR